MPGLASGMSVGCWVAVKVDSASLTLQSRECAHLLTFRAMPQWSRMQQWLLALLLCSVMVVKQVGSLPSGAAGCAKGSPAVQGYHLDYGPGSVSLREGLSGSLLQLGTVFLLNNVTVDPAAPPSFSTGTNITWSIINTGNISLRGILVRVESPSPFFTVFGDGPKLQDARACDSQSGNVIGITHRDRSDKNYVSGVMRFDAPTTVTLDVNTVYRNGRVAPGNTSYYAYNAYKITVTGPKVPTPAIAAPTKAPVPPARCDTNGCTSLFGYKGQIMKYQLGGLCLARCIRSSLVGVRKISGWKCGTCGFEPPA
jgi:hypothetical protein